MTTYYNEWDPFSASRLRNAIRLGLIPDGVVDTRSILEVKASDLEGFTQCHFFAGIGGWPYALRLANVRDDAPIWTASLPCQPFSLADNSWKRGKQLDDERHLFPAFFELVKERKPVVVAGEQVRRAIKVGWLDSAFSSLEDIDYACAAALLPACGYGADHERNRVYWLANAGGERRSGFFEDGRSLPCISRQDDATSRHPLAHGRRAARGDYSDILPLHGLSFKLERNLIRGFGNAIVPEIGAEFIAAALEALEE